MAFTDSISRDDASALIPEDVATSILTELPQACAVMQMGKKLQNMARNELRMPILSTLPTAYFVNGDSSLVETSEAAWTNKYIDAEEIAVIVPLANNVADDADYDIWAEVKPLLVEAFGAKIDGAVLAGTNIPASWTTNLGGAGLKAVCTAASQTVSLASYTDIYEALLGETGAGTKGTLALIEEDGYMANGHIAHVSVKGKLRNCRDSEGQPIFKAGPLSGSFATGELDGAPLAYPLNGGFAASTALMFSGDWTKLVYAVRKDITYKIETSGVITDASGKIIYNLFQQNMSALMATMRIGFALPNPINRMNGTAATRCAFACLTA